MSKDLFKACELEVYSDIKKILATKTISVNEKDEKGDTPLLIISKETNKKIKIAKLLIKYGADVNIKDKNNFSPLFFAYINKNHKLVALLINNGATYNIYDLVQFGDLKRVKTILDQGFDINKKNEKGDTLLMLASSEGYQDIVELLIKYGADINAKDKFLDTPLMLATKRNHEAITKILLKYGANSNSKNIFGETPINHINIRRNKELYSLFVESGYKETLFDAIKLGNLKNVVKLLEQGFDINIVDKDGDTSLILAITDLWSKRKIIEALINYGADLNIKNSYGYTALSFAYKNKNKKLVNLLIKKGAKYTFFDVIKGADLRRTKKFLKEGVDISSRDEYGNTALSYAVRIGDITLIKLLLDNKADINQKDRYGNTPLIWAIVNNYEAIVKLLLEYKPNLELTTINDIKPIKLASNFSDKKVLRLLINSGAEYTLFDVIKAGDMEKIELLLKQGANINSKDIERGESPLILAYLNNSTPSYLDDEEQDLKCEKILELLLKHGAEPNLETNYGMTILQLIYRGYRKHDNEIMKLLIKYGARYTLFDVIKIGDVDRVKAILKHGVDVNALNMYNENALIMATKLFRNDIVELLVNHGADINFEDEKGNKAINFAYSLKNEKLIEFFKSKGVKYDLFDLIKGRDILAIKEFLHTDFDINSKTKGGYTPLMLAVQQNDKELVELLLAHGADINIKNNSGETALKIASKNDTKEIFNLLQVKIKVKNENKTS